MTTPALTRMRGPRGPSGVKPAHSPALSDLTIARKAALPPCLEEPATVAMPKYLTVRAMSWPSRWRDISMLMRTRPSQQ